MSVTVKTADLVGLLTDLVKSTADSTLPALHAVQLYTSQDGAWLVGNSTDRYVAAQATTEIVPPVTAVADAPADVEPAGILPVILVPVSSVKLILSTIKAAKYGDSHLTVEGDKLKVDSIAGVTTVPLLEEHVVFPKVGQLFNAPERADVGQVVFSDHVLSVAQAVAKRRKESVCIVFTGTGKPAHVRIGANYRVLMMPTKHDGDIELPAFHDLPSTTPVTAAA